MCSHLTSLVSSKQTLVKTPPAGEVHVRALPTQTLVRLETRGPKRGKMENFQMKARKQRMKRTSHVK